jgi:hypothetical protein
VNEVYFSAEGGVDLEQAPNQLMPGQLIGVENYEIDKDQGYKRVQGYERYDGQPSPAASTYAVLYFTAGTIEPTTGDTTTGGTSAATGKHLAAPVVESGTWAGGDAAGYAILGRVTGTFVDGEALTFATASGTNLTNGAPTAALHLTYTGLAQEDRRNDILALPGNDDVLGVWVYNGDRYGFRDDSGTCKMYKATSAGWVVQALGSHLPFNTGGNAEILEGDVITSPSGAIATVKMITARDLWSNGTATGRMTVDVTSGTFATSDVSEWIRSLMVGSIRTLIGPRARAGR